MRDSSKNLKALISCFLLIGLSLSCVQRKSNIALILPSETTQKQAEETKEEPLMEEEGFICPRKKADEGCWQSLQCRGFCDEMFDFSDKSRRDCYKWPLSLFPDFEQLFESLKQAEFESLEPEVFQCWLDFSEDNHKVFFRHLNEQKSKDFLAVTAYDSELAYNIYQAEENNFPLLSGLYRKIGSQTPSAVKEDLARDKDNFLMLIIHYENKQAWDWLDEYLSYKCEKDNRCAEPLEYYCKILDNLGYRNLEDFFESSLFKRAYKRDIESKECGSQPCEYGKVLDFYEICDKL